MFDVKIGDETRKAEVTFYTAALYESEFQSDIVADLFGVQGKESNPFSLAKGGAVVSIDFSKVGWQAVQKATWAALKTADPALPSYATWIKKARGVNFWELREALMEDASDCFFRTEAADEEAQAEE